MADGVRRGRVTGYRCATCGATVPIDTVHPFRCPAADRGASVMTTGHNGGGGGGEARADEGTAAHHVLHLTVAGPDPVALDDPNPFVAYGPSLAWWAFATARG